MAVCRDDWRNAWRYGIGEEMNAKIKGVLYIIGGVAILVGAVILRSMLHGRRVSGTDSDIRRVGDHQQSAIDASNDIANGLDDIQSSADSIEHGVDRSADLIKRGKELLSRGKKS